MCQSVGLLTKSLKPLPPTAQWVLFVVGVGNLRCDLLTAIKSILLDLSRCKCAFLKVGLISLEVFNAAFVLGRERVHPRFLTIG